MGFERAIGRFFPFGPDYCKGEIGLGGFCPRRVARMFWFQQGPKGIEELGNWGGPWG